MALALIFCTLFSNVPDCSAIRSVREEYHNIETEIQLNNFISNIGKMNCQSVQPYLASAIMQKARYAFWPITKFKYFDRGKKSLEGFIKKNPASIEGRYVRVLVQSEIPGFLGYNHHLESDAKFIKHNIKDSDLPEKYQRLIIKNINTVLKKDN